MQKALKKTRNPTEYSYTEVLNHLSKAVSDMGEKSDHAFTPYHRRSLKIYSYDNLQSKKTPIRTSYTQGTDFRVSKRRSSFSSNKKNVGLPFFKENTSNKTTETCFSVDNLKNSLSSSQQIVRNSHKGIKSKSMLMKQHQIQLQHYKQTYGNLSFSISQVISGLGSQQSELKFVSSYVQEQFQPILSYQFSKLSRKDILPSLPPQKKAQSAKAQKRMAYILKSNFISAYPVAYWK